MSVLKVKFLISSISSLSFVLNVSGGMRCFLEAVFIFFTRKPGGCGGGGGLGDSPSYKLYRYVPPHWVGFLCCFGLKTRIHFAHFGLESGMIFEGITGVYERICYE